MAYRKIATHKKIRTEPNHQLVALRSRVINSDNNNNNNNNNDNNNNNNRIATDLKLKTHAHTVLTNQTLDCPAILCNATFVRDTHFVAGG